MTPYYKLKGKGNRLSDDGKATVADMVESLEGLALRRDPGANLRKYDSLTVESLSHRLKAVVSRMGNGIIQLHLASEGEHQRTDPVGTELVQRTESLTRIRLSPEGRSHAIGEHITHKPPQHGPGVDSFTSYNGDRVLALVQYEVGQIALDPNCVVTVASAYPELPHVDIDRTSDRPRFPY